MAVDVVAQPPTSRRGIASFFPILGWLPTYNRSWLRPDIIAGITVTALLVPEGMAYAELAGMPPETIFYAAPAALLLYAIFGTSRQLVVVVSSVQAVMSFSIVSALAPPETPEFIVLTTALAITAGFVAILAGLLRLGRIAQFFSASVLAGFVSGLAIVVAVKQLPKIFGIESAGGNVWERLYDLIIHLPETHMLTLVVGLSTIAVMLLLEHYFHRIPAALVAMIFGIVVSAVFGLSELGVHVVGEVPSGLAPPKLPGITIDQWLSLIPGALALSLVVFAEAIGPARGFATKYRYGINPDQELIGLGAANVGAGLFQGFPIGSSLSKTAANDAAGAKSQMSGIVAAGLTILVALFLTPLFRDLPEATLAAIVVVAVSGMFKWREMLRLYKLRRVDFALALVTFLAVLTFEEALLALLLAVVLSLLALVWRTSQGRLSELGLVPGTLRFEEVGAAAAGAAAAGAEATPIAGLLIFAPEESLFFANADTVRVQITNRLAANAAAAAAPVGRVVLDLELTNELDVPSADMVKELHDDLDAAGVELLLARVRPAVRDLLDRSGATAKLGAEHIYGRVLEGVLYHLSARRHARRDPPWTLGRRAEAHATGCGRDARPGRRRATGAARSACHPVEQSDRRCGAPVAPISRHSTSSQALPTACAVGSEVTFGFPATARGSCQKGDARCTIIVPPWFARWFGASLVCLCPFESGRVPIQIAELLRTKLQRPGVTRDLIPRPRLIERLNQAVSVPLTLVCAPAGFGKSTLASSWIEGMAAGGSGVMPRLPAAWLSLDESDSDLILFLRYFIAALHTIVPGACARSAEMIEAPQQPSTEVLFATLSNEIALLPDHLLVLDDYYAIQGEDVHEFLNFLVRHWPPPLHLVLISRHNPPLPLARLPRQGIGCRDPHPRPALHPRGDSRVHGSGAARAAQRARLDLARAAHRGLDRRHASGRAVAARWRGSRNPAGSPVWRRHRHCRLPGGRGALAPTPRAPGVSAAHRHPGSLLRLAV